MHQGVQVILAGEGGQGLVIAGRILALAALEEGKNVVQTQSYGTASRGGFTQAEVIFSNDPIYYPHCDKPHAVLALSQTAYDRYRDKIPPECLIIYDLDLVQPQQRANQTGYQLYDLALDLGNEQVLNILSLGYILRNFPVLKPESVEKGIKKQLPEKFHTLNIHTFRIGLGTEEVKF